MLNVKNVTIDEITCQLNPIDPFDAVRLDRKVIGLVGPIIAPIMAAMAKKPDADVDVSMLLTEAAAHLNSVPDSEYMPLISELLSSVVATAPGIPALQLNSRENIAKVLSGRGVLAIYKICLEVIRFNKFLPFAMGGLLTLTGGATPTTSTMSVPMQTSEN